MCAKGAGGGDASCVLRVLVEGMPHVCQGCWWRRCLMCAKGAGGGDASCVLRVLVEGMPHI